MVCRFSVVTPPETSTPVKSQNLSEMKEWHKYIRRSEGTRTRFRFIFYTITFRKIYGMLTCIIKSLCTYHAIIEATAAPFWVILVVRYRHFRKDCRSHHLRLLDSCYLGQIGRPETSVTTYQTTPNTIPRQKEGFVPISH